MKPKYALNLETFWKLYFNNLRMSSAIYEDKYLEGIKKSSINAKRLEESCHADYGCSTKELYRRVRMQSVCEMLLKGHSEPASALKHGFNNPGEFTDEFLKLKRIPVERWIKSQKR